MGFLRIHCHNCGGYWEVYGRDNWTESRSRTCPHCHEKIDGQDWDKEVLPAFGAMMDANRELDMTHRGFNTPLFTVDYIDDHYFPDAKKNAEINLFNLGLRIQDLHDIVSDAVEAIEKKGKNK